MKRKITPSDIFDVNKKSGALILGKNRLDDYATKFLTKYCKQALVEPMPLPVDDILKDMGLTVQEVHLSSDLSESMKNADVSNLNAQCVLALIMGAVRAERFCDGALLDSFKSGCILKWLERLNNIE